MPNDDWLLGVFFGDERLKCVMGLCCFDVIVDVGYKQWFVKY